MDNTEDVKVQSSFLIPLSLKRWIEDQARGQGVSTAVIVREVLEKAKAEREQEAQAA